MSKGNTRIARRAKEAFRIMDRYKASDEAKGLDRRTTEELIELHNGDDEWLRHPCGDLYIDAQLCARAELAGKILKARGVRWINGKFVRGTFTIKTEETTP